MVERRARRRPPSRRGADRGARGRHRASARLGLADDEWERLSAEVATVFHLAAIYNLAVPLEIAQRVNVGRTGNVLDFCLGADGSSASTTSAPRTCRACARGVVYEHELALGQEFKNHYESTKFQAEVWVRETMDEVPTTILRPAIVVGDSQTGETAEVRRALLHAARDLEARSAAGADPAVRPLGGALQRGPGGLRRGRARRGAGSDAADGRDPPPGGPEPVTRAELLSLLAREYAGAQPAGRIPPWLVEASLRSSRSAASSAAPRANRSAT